MELVFDRKGFKSKFWIGVLLLVILILLLTGFLIWLLFYNQRLASKILELKEEIGRLNYAIGSLVDLKRDSPKATELISKLSLILPDTEGLLEISSELEEISRSLGLNQNFAFGSTAPATEAEPKSVGFSLSLTGDPAKFVQYFKQIEDLPYILNFNQIDISLTQGIYQFNSSGKIYSQ
jgi:Tfp pilus assembly protein PilO